MGAATAGPGVARTGTAARALLFAGIFLNSGVLWSEPDFFAIPWGNEAWLGLLCTWMLLVYVPGVLWRGRLSFDEAFVLALCAVLVLWPAVAALAAWGQPLHYGVIEERRALGYLVFFPLYIALRRGTVSADDILRWVFMSALACVALSAVYYLFGMEREAFELDEVMVRQDRVRIGVHYVLLAFFYALSRTGPSLRSVPWLLASFLFLLDIFVFTQSRQLALAALGVPLLFAILRPVRLLYGVVALTVLGVAFVLALPDFTGYLADKYRLLLGSLVDQGLGTVREQTLGDAWQLFVDSHGLGAGSLSQLWNDGYHRIFGPTFFLADIGFVGSLVRFGVFALCVHGAYWTWLLVRARALQDEGHVRFTVRAYVTLALVVSGMYTFIEFCGGTMGIVMAILAASAARPREAA